MDHLPPPQANTHMCNLSFAFTITKEKQITNFKGWLDGFCGTPLHICVSRNFNPQPAMEQARKSGTVNTVAACATPKIGNSDHAHRILHQSYPLLFNGFRKAG